MNHSFFNSRQAKGQGLVEYALVLVLVAIVVVGALMVLGPIIGNSFSTINASLTAGGGGGGGGGSSSSAAPTQVAVIEGDAARSEYCAERPGYSGGVNWGFAGGHTWTSNGQTYTVTGDPFSCPYP